MKTVPVHEAEARLSELLAAVELGEEITITRHGRPVARIVAVADASAVALTQRERVARTFAHLQSPLEAVKPCPGAGFQRNGGSQTGKRGEGAAQGSGQGARSRIGSAPLTRRIGSEPL